MTTILLSALLLAATPATAQVAPAAPAQAAPAPAPAPDPARLAVARKLMDQIMPPATRDQMMQSLIGAMSQRMTGAITQNPELIAALEKQSGARAVLDRFIARQMKASTDDLIANLPGMLDAMARAYARRFTLQQLNDMAVFFATPSGQAYIAGAPTVMADPDVGAWMTALMTRSMQRLPNELAALKAEIEALEKTKKSGS